jgi:2-polyprenyl-3-methyl-5-hydroxy-6-metoxy-1,4-benzoquinol methylase
VSQRFKIAENVNDSKNTRLDVAAEFGHYRFGRDAMAHVSRYMFIAEAIIALAKERGRPITVLDVGCGDLYILRTLVASYRVKKSDICSHYVGFDIDEIALARAKDTLPDCVPVTLHQGDVTLRDLVAVEGRPFDLVICTEVLEHIQPEFVPKVLEDLHDAARRDLIISTPNVTGGTGKIPADHVKEWECEELTMAMRRARLLPVQRIGTFSNLNRVRRLAKKNPALKATLDFLTPRMDSNLLSLVMARYIGTEAQNVLYRLRVRDADGGSGE